MDFAIPMLTEIKDENMMSPEEYTYWKGYQNRTFYVDYEIDEDYSLIELGKIIIHMNMEEKDIPKENLKPIYIFVHSYGGDLDQSLYFSDLLCSSRIPIVTVAMGASMSGGFLIFLAGHRRYVFEHSSLLAHSGSGHLCGTAEQIEASQQNYKKQIESMRKYILSKTEIPEKVFNKNKNKDWYISTEEVELYKIATVIKNFEDII